MIKDLKTRFDEAVKAAEFTGDELGGTAPYLEKGVWVFCPSLGSAGKIQDVLLGNFAIAYAVQFSSGKVLSVPADSVRLVSDGAICAALCDLLAACDGSMKLMEWSVSVFKKQLEERDKDIAAQKDD